jgi:hypothetical protein
MKGMSLFMTKDKYRIGTNLSLAWSWAEGLQARRHSRARKLQH